MHTYENRGDPLFFGSLATLAARADRRKNLASVTNARGKTTGYTYSANDLLERVEDATGRVWELDYDAVGNLTHTTYPDGHGVSRSYDECGLLDSMEATSGLSYGYAYDANHSLISVEGAGGASWGWTYDDAGRVKTSSDDLDGSAFTATRTYDEAGRVSALAATGLPTRASSYDLASRLVTLTPDDGAPGDAVTFGYDRSGLVTSRVTPDGAHTGYAYDEAGRLSSIAATLSSGVIAFDYTRDANGRVISENSSRFSYDELGRLVSWYDPSADATTTYTYDAASNLTGRSVDGSATLTLAFDDADRITSSGYAYDANGNLTSRPGQRLTYDALNRLTAVIDASTDATMATYTYDHLNRRASATEASGTVFFHYDGASPDVIAETDEQGDLVASWLRDSSGRLVAMERGGERYFYHLNARGDVVALTDEDGDVVDEYAYDPYGRALSASETVENPYRYAGYRFDEESGLYQLWNRSYNPVTARFITRDLYPGELDSPATMNGYVYCLGDPVNLVDTNGLEPLPATGDGTPYGRGNDNLLLSRPSEAGFGLLFVGGLLDFASFWLPSSKELDPFAKGMAKRCGPAFVALGTGYSLDSIGAASTYEQWKEGYATKGDVIQSYLSYGPGGTLGTVYLHGLGPYLGFYYAQPRQ
jgi:RHS repeat-associated protein